MRLKNFIIFCFFFAVLLVVQGCSTGGMFTAGNLTDVQLQKGNYKIIMRGASGESSAAYLLGFTAPMGMTTNTVALVRVDGSGMLYKEALDNLWKNYEAANGSSEGKKLALVNVHYDSDALNLIVYTQAKLIIRADIVEFID